MSPQRADAAHIAPYLTHVVAHHGQLTVIPPDNAGRMRQPAKGKKPAKARSKPERPVRSEEERFNVGPRSLRTLATTRGGRRSVTSTRQDPRRDDRINDGINDDIPDYPPPSFMEAMSTPPMSPYPNSSTYSLQYPPSTPTSASPQLSVSARSASSRMTSPSSLDVPAVTETQGSVHPSRPSLESDSDGSLDFVDMDPVRQETDNLPANSLEDRVRRDFRTRHGIDFPSPTSPEERTFPLVEDGVHRHSPPRGRTTSRPRGVLEDPDDEETEPAQATKTSKRRHLSLSPLRTLFPSRPSAVNERAMSAHPAPESSPYSFPSSFFRSTTSLMPLSAPSLLRLPLTPTSSTFPSVRHESIMSRKLFSHKGKEKATAEPDIEPMDAWEVVESEHSPTNGTPSIMTALEKMAESTYTSPVASPTRAQSFTYGSPIPAAAPAPPTVTQSSPEPPLNYNTPHPLSLRDRKVLSLNFTKPRRTAPKPPSPSATQTLASSDPIPPVPSGPVLTSVRVRKPPPPPPPKKKPQAHGASPLSAGPWRADSLDSSQSPAAILQRALETPLPLTPVDSSHFEHRSIAPIIENGDLQSSSHPTLILRGRHPTVPADLISVNDIGVKPEFSVHLESGHPFDLRPTPDPAFTGTTMSGASTPTRAPSPTDDTSFRHHYLGRPLPRPPGSSSRNMIDSTYAPNENDQVGGIYGVGAPFPEGLLIDLDDDSLSSTPSGATTPVIPPTTENGGAAFDPSAFSNHNSTRARPQQTGQPGSPIRYSEFTDLDVLVSRLSDSQRADGSDYEALLQVSEFLGPADRTDGRPVSCQNRPSSGGGTNSSLLGNVEIARRRTMKDGRVKLKLSLLNVSVDKCPICQCQFKSGESAELIKACQHAFHELCLQRWLIQSNTCPVCRVSLNDYAGHQ